jgi:hypothetical protein
MVDHAENYVVAIDNGDAVVLGPQRMSNQIPLGSAGEHARALFYRALGNLLIGRRDYQLVQGRQADQPMLSVDDVDNVPELASNAADAPQRLIRSHVLRQRQHLGVHQGSHRFAGIAQQAACLFCSLILHGRDDVLAPPFGHLAQDDDARVRAHPVQNRCRRADGHLAETGGRYLRVEVLHEPRRRVRLQPAQEPRERFFFDSFENLCRLNRVCGEKRLTQGVQCFHVSSPS